MAALLTAGSVLVWPGVASAVEPPVIDPAALPPDTVGPEPGREWELRKQCMVPFAKEGSQFGDPPWSSDFLQLAEAHKYAQGEGVLVALIDTGVNPDPERLPVEPGGDYLSSGDGLTDCDGHGTLMASLIAGRPSPDDKFVGVAPRARIVSIRNTSTILQEKSRSGVDPNDPNQSKPAGTARDTARAIVHAANLGASVINISETACLKVSDRVDQAGLGAAVRYAVKEKDAVVVVAAGNAASGQQAAGGNCVQNPGPIPSNPRDAAGWGQVKTVVTPAWYAPLVLTVGAVRKDGSPADFSMNGPWMGVSAPGDDMTGLFGGHPVDAVPGDAAPVPLQGTSYSAAMVTGVAALIRSDPRFRQMNDGRGLTANQVMDRIIRSSRHPGPGWDNVQGFGPVNALAALTWDIPLGPMQPEFRVRQATPPPQRLVPDYGPVTWVVVLAGGGLALAGGTWLALRARKAAVLRAVKASGR
nr:type VII secretion-associated serine protease mycosin [Mycobacteroides salmoniphilum]